MALCEIQPKKIPWFQAFGFFLNDNTLPKVQNCGETIYKVLPELRSAC